MYRKRPYIYGKQSVDLLLGKVKVAKISLKSKYLTQTCKKKSSHTTST